MACASETVRLEFTVSLEVKRSRLLQVLFQAYLRIRTCVRWYDNEVPPIWQSSTISDPWLCSLLVQSLDCLTDDELAQAIRLLIPEIEPGKFAQTVYRMFTGARDDSTVVLFTDDLRMCWRYLKSGLTPKLSAEFNRLCATEDRVLHSKRASRRINNTYLQARAAALKDHHEDNSQAQTEAPIRDHGSSGSD